MKTINLLALAIASILTVSTAQAAPTEYGNPGTENPFTYTFTAAATGDVFAYYALPSTTAVYHNEFGLWDVTTGYHSNFVLDNHTANYGDSYNLGSVNAGDTLVFELLVNSNWYTWYSDKSLNSDGLNHVYSNSFAGDSKIPAGTYVAFEDLQGGGDHSVNDLNYHDATYVLTNVAAVPEPEEFAMFLLGLPLISWIARRKLAA